MEFERIKRELVYKGAIIDMYKDHVKMPTGHVAEWDFIGHKGAAAVVAVTDDGKLLMVRQYRNAIDRYTLEIPAGARDSLDEETIVCAARELEEETGYTAGSIEWLITVRTTVAFCNEKIDIYLARNLVPGSQNLDEDEFVEIFEVPLSEAVAMIHDGRIVDGKTIAALSYVSLQ